MARGRPARRARSVVDLVTLESGQIIGFASVIVTILVSWRHHIASDASVKAEINAKLDSLTQSVNRRIDLLDSSMNKRIDGLEAANIKALESSQIVGQRVAALEGFLRGTEKARLKL